jgi:hypothetical protein
MQEEGYSCRFPEFLTRSKRRSNPAHCALVALAVLALPLHAPLC